MLMRKGRLNLLSGMFARRIIMPGGLWFMYSAARLETPGTFKIVETECVRLEGKRVAWMQV